MVGAEVSENFRNKKGFMRKKELVNSMQSIKCGHELIKNKNMEDKKIKHI